MKSVYEKKLHKLTIDIPLLYRNRNSLTTMQISIFTPLIPFTSHPGYNINGINILINILFSLFL